MVKEYCFYYETVSRVVCEFNYTLCKVQINMYFYFFHTKAPWNVGKATRIVEFNMGYKTKM